MAKCIDEYYYSHKFLFASGNITHLVYVLLVDFGSSWVAWVDVSPVMWYFHVMVTSVLVALMIYSYKK